MDKNDASAPPAPPGIIQALVAGFNTVAHNAGLLLLPISLDLFLWLGPRLSIMPLLTPFLEQIANSPSPLWQPFGKEEFLTLIKGVNVFTNLRSIPIGVGSLMNANLSLESPLGARPELGITTWPALLIWAMGLVVVGWLVGSLYYRSVAGAALPNEEHPSILRGLLHGVMLSLFWTVAFFLCSIPFSLFVLILMFINAPFALLVAMLAQFVFFGCAISFFFTIHGIFAEKRNFFSSIISGLTITRYGYPAMGWFMMTALLLLQGLDFIWRIPPADSWMALAGIFGHAFITTALLAASFIYYRQMQTWIVQARLWLQSQARSASPRTF